MRERKGGKDLKEKANSSREGREWRDTAEEGAAARGHFKGHLIFSLKNSGNGNAICFFRRGNTGRRTKFEGKELGFVHAIWTWQAASRQDVEFRGNGAKGKTAESL